MSNNVYREISKELDMEKQAVYLAVKQYVNTKYLLESESVTYLRP